MALKRLVTQRLISRTSINPRVFRLSSKWANVQSRVGPLRSNILEVQTWESFILSEAKNKRDGPYGIASRAVRLPTTSELGCQLREVIG